MPKPPPNALKAALASWRHDPVAFITEVLRNPETGAPFELYPAQVEFLRAALRLTPAGRLPCPEMLFSAPKKSGKTALWRDDSCLCRGRGAVLMPRSTASRTTTSRRPRAGSSTEAVPSPTRKVSGRLTVTYAGFEGESELLSAELPRRDLLAPDLYRGGGCLMYWTHRPIAPWHTQDWLDQMRQQLRPNQFLRMIQNQWVTTESNFVEMAWWDQCVDQNLRPVVTDRYLTVWGGVDASVKRDSTAIVLCTWDEAEKRCRLVYHRIFQPSAKDPLDFEATIERTLLELNQRFELKEVRYDPISW